jgi:hypothetical protein
VRVLLERTTKGVFGRDQITECPEHGAQPIEERGNTRAFATRSTIEDRDSAVVQQLRVLEPSFDGPRLRELRRDRPRPRIVGAIARFEDA